MLPAFIDYLDAVAIGVEEICSVVARVVIKTRSGCAVVGGAGGDGGVVGGIDLGGVFCNKADVRRSAIHRSFPQPEKDAAVGAKPFQIGMSRRAVFAVVVNAVDNS